MSRFFNGEQSYYLQKPKVLGQIIALRDTDKWYFAITEFSNCFNNCFDHPENPDKRSANFQTRAWLQLRMSRILNKFSKLLRVSRPLIVGDRRQLFAGHVLSSWPMERRELEGKMHRMKIISLPIEGLNLIHLTIQEM